MKENQIEKGKLSLHARGLGTVTEEMVHQRARELALINGRSQDNVLGSDLEQARRELTGAAPADVPPAKLEQIPEDERWDPVPGSVGRQAPTVPAPDEQTSAEKLVEEGIEDAEQDQMVRATRESLERDKQASEE